jgi:hypothetical protein
MRYVCEGSRLDTSMTRTSLRACNNLRTLSICNMHQCKVLMTRSDGAHEIFCADLTCTEEDEDSCCDLEGSCLTFECPKWYALKPNADELLCADRNITDTSNTKLLVFESVIIFLQISARIFCLNKK